MKNLQLLLGFLFALLFFSCGKNAINTSPRMCEYELTLNPLTVGTDADGNPCEIDIDFVFVSNSGQEFSFSFDAANEDPPTWILPANSTFDMWIVDIGYGGSEACGDYYFDISINGESCGTISDYIEERPDIIDPNTPKATFSTGNCECPNWFF